jgi:hypothetical protein
LECSHYLKDFSDPHVPLRLPRSKKLLQHINGELLICDPFPLWPQSDAVLSVFSDVAIQTLIPDRLHVASPYSEMAIDTLYYPTKASFPMARFFYKKEDGTLVAFQVTRQDKPPKLITQFVVDKFLVKSSFRRIISPPNLNLC